MKLKLNGDAGSLQEFSKIGSLCRDGEAKQALRRKLSEHEELKANYGVKGRNTNKLSGPLLIGALSY